MAHTGLVSSVFLDGGARRSPLLQLGRRNESGRLADRCVPVPRLPPVVIILADHLQNVADAEADAGLHARNQLVVAGVVVEQRSHEDLTTAREHGRSTPLVCTVKRTRLLTTTSWSRWSTRSSVCVCVYMSGQ